MKRYLIPLLLAIVFAPACKINDVATPEELLTIEQAETPAELVAAERSVAERAVGQVVDVMDPFIPVPVRPFVPLLATLLFGRVRRTVAKSLTDVGTVAKKSLTGDYKGAGQAIGNAVDSALSIVGLKDSRNDTGDDLQAMLDAANAAGHTTLATNLEEVIAARAA